MKKLNKFLVRVLSLPIAMYFLSGCGVGNAVGQAIGKGLGEVYEATIICSISSMGAIRSVGIDLDVSKDELVGILAQINEKKITTVDNFWVMLNPEMSAGLKAWVEAGYKKADLHEDIRISDYEDALASGLIQMAKAKKEYGTLTLIKIINTKVNGKIQPSYAKLNIKIIGSTSDEEGYFGLCTQ